ncbi:hypothetical protein VNO78_03361 [Psophocarpus tetragonolobus]|uniref:Uncharacterized protein n=1 Tax=Psophocarpus tetragonolobus TaxID=3891 RepID=A0AAN9XWL0_PSOTE
MVIFAFRVQCAVCRLQLVRHSNNIATEDYKRGHSPKSHFRAHKDNLGNAQTAPTFLLTTLCNHHYQDGFCLWKLETKYNLFLSSPS